MSLYFDQKAQQWMLKFPPKAVELGWDEFVHISRQQALGYVERQFEITFV